MIKTVSSKYSGGEYYDYVCKNDIYSVSLCCKTDNEKKYQCDIHVASILYRVNEVGVKEHRSLGGSIIRRLDNGAFVGLI